ncbi:MAG TPA: hypothetical protein VHD33_01510, partial [Legionellaceae bacterium]|nr:hypothetical protein [Legionellaceae bacterium]
MNPRRYFPLGKAYGEAFCNRSNEVQMIMDNAKNGKHTFLVAPRRYGKSSLCERAIEKLHLPAVSIDLHVATSEKAIERIILKGITELIGKTVNSIEKSIHAFKHLFKHLQPKLSIEAIGFKFELETTEHASTPEVLREAFILLEHLLKSKRQQAIFLIDEFQRVIEIAPDMGIEGGIRSAAQETEYLSFIFSGSSRHLIESIFQNEGRPLYKLCKKLRLDRIDAAHYKTHLNNAAYDMWQMNLPDPVFDMIMNVTERHPYYVNYICDALWSKQKKLPDIADVFDVWQNIIDEERSDILTEFYTLTENQKKLLIYLVSGHSIGLYTMEASKLIGMPTTSIPKTLTVLINRYIIEEYDNKQYRV